ncbi:MAG: GntR family transcriptional regulator, partial [Chitinispirillaceae bacterium]|nr:GntR family transcriptional regulator [Chitinispirillaceae bacterium]
MKKKSSRRMPAFSKVREYILTQIQDLPSQGTTLLPSTRCIAHECRVNRGTVLRVIHALSSEGLIQTVRKPSINIVRGSSTEAFAVNAQQTLGPRSMEVCRSLLRDIIDCRLQPGSTLPSFKELRAAYGCSSVTIHAVVNNLVATGHVRRFGHGYRIHRHGAVGIKLFLTLIIPEKRPKTGRIPNRIAGFWIDIARECDRLNVNLETYGYYCSDSARERREQLRKFTNEINDRVLGYFIMLVDS